MGSPQTGFYSTPAFELFRRGLTTETVKKFRGINAYQTFAQLGPEWALDLLNVIVGSDGALHKFRLPQVISPNLNFPSGPQTFIDFQQANGTRQVAAFFNDGTFEIFTADMTANTFIEKNALNTGLWSLVVLKNQLFGTNGQRMQKWLGSPVAAASWQQIGIVAPATAPLLSFTTLTNSLTRAANVVTVQVANGPTNFGTMPAVGDNLTVQNAGDSTFNGNFVVATVNYSTYQFTYAQTAANASTTAGVQLFSASFSNPITAIARLGNVVTVTMATTIPISQNSFVTISGVTDTSFDVTAQVTGFPSSTTITFAQIGPDASSSGGNVGGALKPQKGYQWAVSYGNSVTGHVSNASPVSITSQIGTPQRGFNITAPAATDPQVDTYYFFRTLDGGGDFFLVQKQTLRTFLDTVPDANIDTTQRAPQINNVPPQCQFFVVGQGRLFGFNVTGAPQDVIYSGYEQILLGNPSESFPPNNRLRLSIGAEQVSGGGVLQNGVVAFSQTGKMFMFRGNIQDISVTVPVIFTQYLQELPWALGCLSNWSIQSTPYGLIWVAADKTVQFFDGSNQPQDISKPFYPILRTITAGTENQIVSAYFNWLDRDWYLLSCATGGSTANNRLFLWSLDREVGEIEMFVSDVQADYVSLVTSSKLQRQLIISQKGQLYNLPASQDTRGGLVSDLTLIPPTSGQMNAFWRGGYFGNQSPQRMKTFRGGRLITDQGSFLVQYRLVDDDSRTFLQPEVRGPYLVNGSKFSISRKAKRCSVEIDFPVQDVSANVIEMQVSSIPTADRI